GRPARRGERSTGGGRWAEVHRGCPRRGRSRRGRRDRLGDRRGRRSAPDRVRRGSRRLGRVGWPVGVWFVLEGRSSVRPPSKDPAGVSVVLVEVEQQGGDAHVPATEV